MKALVWEAPRVMALRERARPTVADDEVLIKVTYAGICGSELSGYLGHNALRVPPLVMGHEFAGEVVALGANAQSLNCFGPTRHRQSINLLRPMRILSAGIESTVRLAQVDWRAEARVRMRST